MTANQNTRCRLVGRFMDGVNLVGYQVIDSEGTPSSVSKETALKLASRGLIDNARYVEDKLSGRVALSGVGMRLSSLPALNMRTGATRNMQNDNDNITKLTVVARIMKGTSVIGYVATDATGHEFKLSQEKVWQLAREGTVSNVAAQLSKGHKILRSVDSKRQLRDLPTVAV